MRLYKPKLLLTVLCVILGAILVISHAPAQISRNHDKELSYTDMEFDGSRWTDIRIYNASGDMLTRCRINTSYISPLIKVISFQVLSIDSNGRTMLYLTSDQPIGTELVKEIYDLLTQIKQKKNNVDLKAILSATIINWAYQSNQYQG